MRCFDKKKEAERRKEEEEEQQRRGGLTICWSSINTHHQHNKHNGLFPPIRTRLRPPRRGVGKLESTTQQEEVEKAAV